MPFAFPSFLTKQACNNSISSSVKLLSLKKQYQLSMQSQPVTSVNARCDTRNNLWSIRDDIATHVLASQTYRAKRTFAQNVELLFSFRQRANYLKCDITIYTYTAWLHIEAQIKHALDPRYRAPNARPGNQ